MSWFFYVCIGAPLFIVAMCVLIHKTEIIFKGNDKYDGIVLMIALACGVVFGSYVARTGSLPRANDGFFKLIRFDFSKQVCLDNTGCTDPQAFTVISNTLFLDNIKTYVLQPGECKMLSAAYGGYRVVSSKMLLNDEQSYSKSGSTGGSRPGSNSDIARRYDELTK